MKTAALLVDLLLEADEPGVDIDPDDIDPEYYLHQHIAQIDRENTEGTLNARTALTARNFWHKTAKYTDGLRAISVRSNGATKTWKTRPGEFRIPVKFGFRECFYITDKNADEWSTQPIADLPKPAKVKKLRPKPVVNPSSLMPPLPPEQQIQVPRPPDPNQLELPL